MAILNVNQYVERVDEKQTLCPRCHALMQKAPISLNDALSVIFSAHRITGRLKCPDCKMELRLTED